MKKCTKCGQIYADENMFCTKCGTKLPAAETTTKICPHCRREIPVDEMFCHFCGGKQLSETTQTGTRSTARRVSEDAEAPKIHPAVMSSGSRGESRRAARTNYEEDYEEVETTPRRSSSSRSRQVEDFDEEEYTPRSTSRQTTRRSSRYEEDDYDSRYSGSRSGRGSRYSSDYDNYDDDDYDDYDEGMPLGMKIAIAVIAVVAVLAIAAVAFLIFGRGGSSKKEPKAQTQAVQETQAPAAQNTQAAETKATTAPTTAAPVSDKAPEQTYGELQVIPATVTASSSLDNATYGTANLTDLNASTVWAEGESGLGEGSTISYTFGGATWVYGIAILPGNQTTRETYDQYPVPTKLTVDTGKVQIPISLQNYKPNFSNPTGSCAYFKFSQPVQANEITVRIDTVKAGSTSEDTCISELYFFEYPADQSRATSARPQIAGAGSDSAQQPASGEGQAADGSTAAPAAAEGDYILPNSSSEKVTEDQLAGLSKEQLRYARNEIFARHGYIFGDSALQSYFESKSWYQGTIRGSEFDDSVLSDTELANIKTILDAEGN